MTHHINERLPRLFLLITAVGVVHMAEQILFGVEEYRMLRGFVGKWHGLFPSTFADEASVILITLIFASVSLMIYAMMRGGAAGVMLLFGLLGVHEAHHVVEAVLERGYDPGLVTSLPFVYVGWLLLREAWSGLAPGLRNATTGGHG